MERAADGDEWRRLVCDVANRHIEDDRGRDCGERAQATVIGVVCLPRTQSHNKLPRVPVRRRLLCGSSADYVRSLNAPYTLSALIY